jgi:hypothetical protein
MRPKAIAGLFKKLFIHLLDVQSFFDAAPYAVPNHQARQLVTVDENYPLAQLLRRLTCSR